MALRVYILVATTTLVFAYCYGWNLRISAWNTCHAASHMILYNTRLDKCARECAVRDSCVAVQYQRMKHMCGILTQKQLDTPLKTCKRFTYIRKRHISHTPQTCEPYKQSLTDGSCITECSLPINLQIYATVEGFPFLGSRIKVTCNSPTIHDGDHYLECTDTGEFKSPVPICRLQSDINLALQKPAWQSSIEIVDVPASLAVDGKTSGAFSDGTCTHTALDDRPWWVVDFGLPYIIKRVTVYNRQGCCEERFADVYIYVSTTNNLSNDELSGSLCARKSGPFSEQIITFQCQDDIVGRYMKIILNRSGTYLTMCEVQVQGETII